MNDIIDVQCPDGFSLEGTNCEYAPLAYGTLEIKYGDGQINRVKGTRLDMSLFKLRARKQALSKVSHLKEDDPKRVAMVRECQAAQHNVKKEIARMVYGTTLPFWWGVVHNAKQWEVVVEESQIA
jgi:hypothetical protein